MKLSQVELTTSESPPHQPLPIRFSWEGEWLEIIDIGRSWTSEQHTHYLVRTAQNQLFELVHNKDKNVWFIKPRHLPHPAV